MRFHNIASVTLSVLLSVSYANSYAISDFSRNYYEIQDAEDSVTGRRQFSNDGSYFLIGLAKGTANVATSELYYEDKVGSVDVKSLKLKDNGITLGWIGQFFFGKYQQIKLTRISINNTLKSESTCSVADGNSIPCSIIASNVVTRLAFLTSISKAKSQYKGFNFMMGMGYNKFTSKMQEVASGYANHVTASKESTTITFDVSMDLVMFKKMIVNYSAHYFLDSSEQEYTPQTVSFSWIF